ncbi:MAG: hypothetical protein SCI25_14100, partial [Desulfuromonadales bacterium]|nr:hypothetical protein [Desulfuromonadales bacterium]
FVHDHVYKILPSILSDSVNNASISYTLSQYDVVYLDQGSNSGLQIGNLLNITREREASDLAIQSKKLTLPEVLLGAAVVIETRPESASALVLKSVAPMYRGDRVTALTE